MGTSTPPVCPPVTTSSTTSSATAQESDAMWPAGARTRLTEPSSLSPRRSTSPSSPQDSARTSSRLLSMLVNQEQAWVTGSSSTPARFVPEERLARMPALGMEDHLWYVRLSLEDGPWWVWCPGALDVPQIFLEST